MQGPDGVGAAASVPDAAGGGAAASVPDAAAADAAPHVGAPHATVPSDAPFARTAPAHAPFARSRYAGLVSRLLALGVDAVVVGTAVAVVGAGGPALWHTLTGENPDWLRVCASVVAGVVPVLYFWLAWWLLGRSLGGLLLGSIVLRSDGRRMHGLHAAARAFLGLLFAPLWLAGMLLILVEPRRRALHDVLLGTVVARPTHDPVDHPPPRTPPAAPSPVRKAPP